MKNRNIQILIIIICVSTFFIVKDVYIDSDNPFEKVEEGPNRISYSKWSDDNNEIEYRSSYRKEEQSSRNLIMEYLKSMEYKKISGQRKQLKTGFKYSDEEFRFKYNRVIRTGEHSSELLSERINIDYFEVDESRYLVIRSKVKDVKSGSYKIISDFDVDNIKSLLNLVE